MKIKKEKKSTKFKGLTDNQEHIGYVGELVKQGKNITHAVLELCDKLNYPYSDSLRRSFSRKLEREGVTEKVASVKNENLSAQKPDGSIMTVDEYCDTYGLIADDIKSYKLVTHTGVPYYNIQSTNVERLESQMTIEDIKLRIKDELSSYKYNSSVKVKDGAQEVVVTLADLHFGAYIDNLLKTKPFNIDILSNMLNEIADIVNEKHKGKVVHVHILGDIIESFTGLNHINSWKGLQKGMIGAEVVKLSTTVIHTNLLSRINKLASVKIIAGNHDRVTSNKAEDTDGDVANLVAWGLKLIGYNVDYNPFILTHLVDGINYILLHGHDSVSKKTTKDICWDYGVQGVFNFITEGHLHSIIEKLSVAQLKNFKTIKDDAVDHRRMNCPSLFRGNSYSERLGYTSNSGFLVSENNGKGIPNVYMYAL